MFVLRSARWWLLALLLLGSAFFFSARADFEDATKIDFIDNETYPGAVYVHITISGHTNEFLLDTGATSSAVSRKLLGKLVMNGSVAPLEKRIIELANGGLIIAWLYLIDDMVIGGCDLGATKVLVFQGNSFNILGMADLEKMGFVGLDLEKRKMVFYCPK